MTYGPFLTERQSGTEMLPEHAGFLMALGLNGHLRNLKRMNMYEYLSRHHEMTNVALLIGLSATYRGTYCAIKRTLEWVRYKKKFAQVR